jgi:predicted nucleotidyltransferase
MLKTKAEIVNIIQDYGLFVSQVFEKVEIILFGSYAKGTAHEWSDIDIAVVSPDFNHIEYFTALKMLNRIKQKISIDLNIIPMTPEDYTNAPAGSIEAEVIKTGQVAFKI